MGVDTSTAERSVLTELLRDVGRERRSAELASRALGLCKRQWCVHLLYALGAGPHRFNALGRAFPGLSGKVLTETLHALERDRLVARGADGAYHLTTLGRSMLEPLDQLAVWTARHEHELGCARERPSTCESATRLE
jgi:DNA-binding HxlR family transcriptional regulator